MDDSGFVISVTIYQFWKPGHAAECLCCADRTLDSIKKPRPLREVSLFLSLSVDASCIQPPEHSKFSCAQVSYAVGSSDSYHAKPAAAHSPFIRVRK
jgi:hypothetical protein